MEGMGCIPGHLAKHGLGNPLAMISRKDNDSDLGAQMVRFETGEVGNPYRMTVEHDDEPQLAIEVNIALLRLKIATDGIPRTRGTAGRPGTKTGVILYLVYKLKVFGFESA